MVLIKTWRKVFIRGLDCSINGTSNPWVDMMANNVFITRFFAGMRQRRKSGEIVSQVGARRMVLRGAGCLACVMLNTAVNNKGKRP